MSVDTRLRDGLHRTAHHLPPVETASAFEAVMLRADRKRRTRRLGLMAAAAAVLVLVLVGAGAVIGAGGWRREAVPATTGSSGVILFSNGAGAMITSGTGTPAQPFRLRHALWAAWSPSGTKLAFVAPGDGSGSDVWVAAADGSNARRIFRCTDPCTDPSPPTWSPDGLEVAFGVYSDAGLDSSIIIHRLADGTRHVIDLPAGFNPGSVSWAPHSRRLAIGVDAMDPGDNPPSTRVAVMDIDRGWSSLTYLTPPAMEAAGPDWDPTGTRLAFISGTHDALENGGESNLFVIRADGTGLHQVTREPASIRAVDTVQWTSNDLPFLVTLAHGPQSEVTLARISSDGTRIQDVTDQDGNPIHGWAPVEHP